MKTTITINGEPFAITLTAEILAEIAAQMHDIAESYGTMAP